MAILATCKDLKSIYEGHKSMSAPLLGKFRTPLDQISPGKAKSDYDLSNSKNLKEKPCLADVPR